jgi:hypothetical protein
MLKGISQLFASTETVEYYEYKTKQTNDPSAARIDSIREEKYLSAAKDRARCNQKRRRQNGNSDLN